ncbi:MAG TPA: CHAT domain-containing protein [Pyrinomonadaceae bacterium]|jgi:CHAT domain-containing protein/tetratricopeptide (TPR) repeat protein
MKQSQERENIKRYLLGDLKNEEAQQNIERRLMTEDSFGEEISISEEEMIDDYLDGRLNRDEQVKFENHFLALPGMQERFLFARVFKAHLGEQQPALKKQNEKKSLLSRLRQFLPARATTALVALIIIGAGFAIWHFVLREGRLDQGLAALKQVYGEKRFIEPRIVGFGYAPLNQTRAPAEDSGNVLERERAKSLLLQAVSENKDAESLHALGTLYLLEKDFDKAIEQLEQAAKLAPGDAKMHADLGAAYLEIAKRSSNNGSKRLESLDKSHKHLEEAIKLDPRLLEPRFNRALNLKDLYSAEQARQAWREYLELDPNSKWADEARRNLESLESQKFQNRSAAELEREFLIAFRQNNDEEAWRLVSRNRELIAGKYLPQRLAMSFLEAPEGEKDSLSRALSYAGELEEGRTGDPLASEIAEFYSALSADQTALLKQAQQAVRNGNKLCLELRYREALAEFNRARNFFSEAGDVWEAKLSEYFIAYCLRNDNRIAESIILFDEIAEYCRIRKYKWLAATSLYWLAGGLKNSKQITRSKKNYEKALALAEEIKDSYALQRNLLELAKLNSFFGQKQGALRYLWRVLEESNLPEVSPRQKYRNYAEALQILSGAKLYNAAKLTALEAVHLADQLKDPMFIVISRSHAGISYAQTGDLARAREWLNEGREKAETIEDESSRKKMIAYSFLKLGYLEKQANNYESSFRFYDEALKQYETLEVPLSRYEAHKGRLLAQLSLGNDAEVGREIPAILEETEKYREQILEEQARTGFFDAEQSVYDLAADYEFRRGNYERAYDYGEISASRSLLDWLHKGAEISGERNRLEILLKDSAAPLPLSEIRRRMPERVQLLQYTVLENRILVWLVSREKFTVVPVEISAEKLREKAENYLRVLPRRTGAAERDAEVLARELYNLLISPIRRELDPTLEIRLIPSKILFYLPFAALLSPGEKPFITEFDVSYAPSANVFLSCTENAAKKNGTGDESLLSIGNPAFDREVFDDLADLPDAKREAEEIAGLYDRRQVLLDREATKSAFRNSLKNADVIHFAGHYVVTEGAPLLSSLALAADTSRQDDGALTGSELIGEKLPRAKLVILSACQTGGEHYYNGEGLIGLSRTFLAAGVPLVVASQWKVDSEATAELMKKFHFYRRKEKLSTAAALRRAQLEMLNAPELERFRKPYYWAGFAAFGGYAEF